MRARLPFAVSTFAGQTPVDGTRAVVYEFVYGTKVAARRASRPSSRPRSARRSPPSTRCRRASSSTPGCRVDARIDVLRAAVALIDRAAATGLVPAALLRRWEPRARTRRSGSSPRRSSTAPLGSDSFLSADASRHRGARLARACGSATPRATCFWLLGSRDAAVAGIAFDAYTRARGIHDRQLRQRATLLSELEVARWLLHGTDERSTEIVDDAVEMLSAPRRRRAPRRHEPDRPADDAGARRRRGRGTARARRALGELTGASCTWATSTVKTLDLVRHAKSSWDDPTLADHDRPLNDRGRHDAPMMGRRLHERGFAPDVILSSTAARAQATADGDRGGARL